MNKYIKGVIYSTAVPFVFGVATGYSYKYAGESGKQNIQDGILGFANIYAFDQLAMLSLVLVSLYVLVKGAIRHPLNCGEKIIVYWLPATALGFVVPFFGALYGFIAGHPPSEELNTIAIIGVFAIIWTAGFLILLLLPAHHGVIPKAEKDKRVLYSIVLFSSLVVASWRHIT